MKPYYLFAVSFILLTSACKKESSTCHKKINFLNNISNSIFIASSHNYPDTLLRNEFPNPITQPQIYEAQPFTVNAEATRERDCIESYFGISYLPSDTLSIYIFDKVILQTTNWDSIKINRMYLKRYDLSLQDLENSNWTITYP